MGMKSKVASMQRGAQKRDSEPQVTNRELYDVSPPLLTDAEMAHFQFGNRSINDFFLGLDKALEAYHRNKLSAAEVSKGLNIRGAKTACGEAWTPRLAWFLMKTWRTVHFAKVERERAAAAKAQDEMATAIGRAVARQEAHSFQKVLRTYFKNPTLGEIFTELAALRQAMEPGHADTPVVAEEPTPKAAKPKRAPLPVAQPVVLNGPWEEFLRSKDGRAYLAGLVRLHPRLLELAPENDIRFLGCLRAKKALHPQEGYWMPEEAEQVRLAILEGLHGRDKG